MSGSALVLRADALRLPGGPVGTNSASDYEPALAICAQCPVVGQCRAAAEAAGDIAKGHTVYGQVVGGVGPKRSVLGRPPKTPKPCGTRSAYERHKRMGEVPCRACTSAATAHRYQYRRRTA